MVLYPRSGFGEEMFVLWLIRFNQESIDIRFLHIVPNPIFNPMRTRFIKTKINLIFCLNEPKSTNMREHNSFNSNCNYLFSNCLCNIEMHMYFTTITYNPHYNQFNIILYSNLTMNMENTFSIYFNRG